MTLNSAVRISGMALRLLFVLQLILGISIWVGHDLLPIGVHLLVGILIVIVVWFLGVAQGLLKTGSIGLTLGTFIAGLLLAFVGLFQSAWLIGGAHWVIQVIHLLLALATVGLGEVSVARYRRGAGAPSA